MTTSEQKKYVKNENLGGISMKKLMKKRLNQKGLTLIELLAVIVILAIVAAIAIPAIGNIIENSRVKAMKSDIANVLNAASIYKSDNGTAPTSGSVLTSGGYIDSWGTVKNTVTFGTASGEITISGEAETKSKTYTLKDVTLSKLKVDDKDLAGTGIEEKK